MKPYWLWDLQVPVSKVRSVLKNPDHPEFFIFAGRLFSRVMNHRQAFEFVSQKNFLKMWPALQERISKDAWATTHLNFWQRTFDSLTQSPSIRHSIAQNIRSLRIKNNLTQIQMANRLGVIQQHISRIESGKENITLESLTKISLALNKKLIIKFS